MVLSNVAQYIPFAMTEIFFINGSGVFFVTVKTFSSLFLKLAGSKELLHYKPLISSTFVCVQYAVLKETPVKKCQQHSLQSPG